MADSNQSTSEATAASSEPFEAKIQAFEVAMDRYNQHGFYKRTESIASTLIVIFQVVTGIHCYLSVTQTNPLIITISFFSAYLLTDFINGLVHMYMDNNTQYHRFCGPFIASFHLHHFTSQYTDVNLFALYFRESGTKFWLVVYLLILASIQFIVTLPTSIHFCLVLIGVLSSFAEVSHFLCHNAKGKQRFITTLQKYGILLSKKHHFIHHSTDNMNYAFLNGVSDPLINLIARHCYQGYKNHSDQHTRAYQAGLKMKKNDPLRSIS